MSSDWSRKQRNRKMGGNPRNPNIFPSCKLYTADIIFYPFRVTPIYWRKHSLLALHRIKKSTKKIIFLIVEDSGVVKVWGETGGSWEVTWSWKQRRERLPCNNYNCTVGSNNHQTSGTTSHNTTTSPGCHRGPTQRHPCSKYQV